MSNNDKENRHNTVDSGDNTDVVPAVFTVNVSVDRIDQSIMHVVLGTSRVENSYVLGVDEAQAFVRTLKLGSEFANTLVKLEPKGHPFYDFLS